MQKADATREAQQKRVDELEQKRLEQMQKSKSQGKRNKSRNQVTLKLHNHRKYLKTVNWAFHSVILHISTLYLSFFYILYVLYLHFVVEERRISLGSISDLLAEV